ncbi:MAG: orotate phosphoribosyltransferase [Bacillota bacterium]|nr:orotate phosphoribosyltransferase [Bacillota bacterium]
MKEIAKKLVEIRAVKLTTPDNLFTWVSGIKSPIYCDNRLIISYPEIRDMVAHGFADAIRAKYPDAQVIAGTATAGIPHAAWVAQILGLPMVYVRSSSKDHGTQKLIEGYMPEGSKVVLIEDLLSTGKSSVAAVKALKAEGADVLGCLAIFSYGFPAVDNVFSDIQVPVASLTNYGEVLEFAEETGLVKGEVKELLASWSKNPRMFTDVE